MSVAIQVGNGRMFRSAVEDLLMNRSGSRRAAAAAEDAGERTIGPRGFLGEDDDLLVGSSDDGVEERQVEQRLRSFEQ